MAKGMTSDKENESPNIGTQKSTILLSSTTIECDPLNTSRDTTADASADARTDILSSILSNAQGNFYILNFSSNYF